MKKYLSLQKIKTQNKMKQYVVVFNGKLDKFKFNDYSDVIYRRSILDKISFRSSVIEVTNEDLVLFDPSIHDITKIFG